MGWKTRGGRSYYYQSEREGGRVVSRYIGAGEMARLSAELQSIERQRREIESFDRQAKQERAERLAARIAKACRRLTVAAEAIIEGAGYHRHHRGQWRRKRIMSTNTLPAPVNGVAENSVPALAGRYRSGDEAARKEVRALIDKADAGDKDAARQIGELMRAAPEIADRTSHDIVRAVEWTMIRRTFGKDSLATAEAVRLKLAALRAELAGPSPSAVERLLAERAALCWLDCYYAEYREIASKSTSFKQADFDARQRDRAQRRYLAALKALAAVRKLPIVAVQVNMSVPTPQSESA